MKTQKISRPHHQSGAALIEAMVAVLILSFGLLGMVGLQTAAVRYEQNSWARSAVSSLVADLGDRIRANPSGGTTAYQYQPTYAAERSALEAGLTNPPIDCASAKCTPVQLAQYDMILWRRSLNTQIPGAVGVISGQSNTAYLVTVAWFDRSWTNVLGNLETSTQCSAVAAGDSAGLRNCCPTSLAAPEGVRCVNFQMIP